MAEIKKSEGGFFVQTDEDELFYLLTCTGVGDIALPAGDETPVYCPSPSTVGAFVITDAIAGEAGLVTYSLDRPLRSTLNYLLTVLRDCRFHGRVNWRVKGSTPDLFANYLVGLHLHKSRVTSSTVPASVVIQPGDNARVDTNADISAFDWKVVYPIKPTKVVQTETEDITDIAFDMSETCYEDEAGGDYKCKLGYYVTTCLVTSLANKADVWFTTDYGVTWTQTGDYPFAGSEDLTAVVTRGGRVIVAREAVLGDPAEIAYSDDQGDTWTQVEVGALPGQGINALWWLDQTHLWAAADSGYVYFSDDQGESWSTQTNGGVTAQNLAAIHAIDQSNAWAVGAAAAIIRTTDGSTWATVTAPVGLADGVTAVAMRNDNRVFIGTDAGELYVTADEGENWTQRNLPGQSSLSTIDEIMFDFALNYFGYIAATDGDGLGRLFRSEDGGASWLRVADMPTNGGFNAALWVCDQNNGWVGGPAHGGLAFLAKWQPVS